MSKIRVLIVDDSKVIQKMLNNILSEDNRIEVVDIADNGLQAYKKILLHKPDVVTLDVNMPIMNGLDLLYTLRKEGLFTRVLLISTLTQSGNTLTLAALDLGAIDFIQKPSADSIMSILNEIIQKILDIGKDRRNNKFMAIPECRKIKDNITSVVAEKKEKNDFAILEANIENVDNAMSTVRSEDFTIPRLVSIGISTGGPRALRIMLPSIAKCFPLPILISQHIPYEFTSSLISSLNGICELNVKEAENDEVIKQGNIYICPGNKNMGVYRNEENEICIKLENNYEHYRYVPSVDYMFSSIAKNIESKAIAIIMTGMGNDGSEGLQLLKKDKALIIAQDEESSTLFGMPRSAIEKNLHTIILSLYDMSLFLEKYITWRKR